MRRDAISRIRLITSAVVILLLVLVIRLYYVQVIHGAEYRADGEGQYVHTVRDLFKRGSIYFSTKNNEKIAAANIETGYLLAIDPSKIVNLQETYDALSAVVEIDSKNFFDRASKKEKTYQEIEKQVDNESADKILALHLKGVKMYRNQWRYYPGKSLGARTIGFVGYNEDTLVGKYGLERYYDDTLKRDNERLSVNFFAEIFSNLGDLIFDSTDTSAGDIVTTIEPTVARALDKALEEAQTKWQSELTGGIIINPMSGEIIALNVVPSFDLNNRAGVGIEAFRNPLVENVYELGSIIKPLTVAAGLDAGVIRPESTYYDAGFLTLSDYTIKNYDGRGRGTVSMQEVLNQSLNTGVAHIAARLGKERFKKYFYGLKLGSETGIDLPNEGHGLVKNLESPREVEFATASFGQGIALTPIGAVRALSTLANGGVLITPHLVKSIEYENGKTNVNGYAQGDRVFKVETSEDITRMLVNVVDVALKGGKAKNPYYTVAAKTGTAQIADPVNGGYYDDRYLHSFFGYFPAYDPKFLIFLYTVEPKGVRYASETLTDPFLGLVQFLINYYELQPDR
ncbi:MAG: penicillin-binding protein 2 [Candidatus Pacebacteria bacterium]|nr:penicillin-binding protein 2 [Candidatus Paceibacterota bacterium]MCF7857147.1 penicillin-binding protein 2 [Candidatus Paceibacterota bacterium]